MPFNLINDWLREEETLGSPNPHRAILATAGKSGIPHSRIVAIREISEEGILFFTQRGTQKVKEMQENPHASITIWLAQQQRQIILNGTICALTEARNGSYWETMTIDRQLRFTAYAPTSAQPIESLNWLHQNYQALSIKYENKQIPMSPYYCGFILNPVEIYFYTLGTEDFSNFFRYTKKVTNWDKQLLSP